MRCPKRSIRGWYCVGTEDHLGYCDLRPTLSNRFLSWLMMKVEF